MTAPFSWAEWRKALGQARGSSTRLSKEERVLKQVSQGQGVVAGLSGSSATDWCNATGQSRAVPQMMPKEEGSWRPAIGVHGAGIGWAEPRMAGSLCWTDCCNATVPTRVIPQMMQTEELLRRRAIDAQGAGIRWAGPRMAGSSFAADDGWMFEGVSSFSAPNESSVDWYNWAGRKRGGEKKLKEERLAKRRPLAHGTVATSAESELPVQPSVGSEGLVADEPLTSVGTGLSEAASAATLRSALEEHRVFLYGMLKENIEKHRCQIVTEIDRAWSGALQYQRTQAHVLAFLETVGFAWQFSGRQCDYSYNKLMVELFPRSTRVLDNRLVPGAFFTDTQFVGELDEAWCLIQGIPHPHREVPMDETMYGTVQCYVPCRSGSWKVGVIDYAPSPAFPQRVKTARFFTRDFETHPPAGARVRFNLKSVQREVWDDAEDKYVQREEKHAFNVCLRHEVSS